MGQDETSPEVPLPRSQEPYEGRVIGERYRLGERLGEGGMGMVFRAEHILMKKTVALKLLHRELGEREEVVRRFEREAQSASRLSHPSIIAVTDFGRAQTGELFLVMEYVAGGSLAALIESQGRFPIERAVQMVRLILRGLDHAHAAGVVHRDLKPANIMVLPGPPGAPDAIKILDFGIAKMSSSGGETGDGATSAALTQSGMIFGTPSYMSPEQATGQDTDARADLYACGIILYELLAGRKPFVADDLIKVMAMQVTANPPPFARTAPGARIPVAIEAVVSKALEKDRSKRFQSANEFLAALDGALEGARGLQAVGHSLTAVANAVGVRLGNGLDWIQADQKRKRIAYGTVAVVAALVLLPLVFMGGKRDLPAPVKPKPIEAAMRTPIKLAEDAMAKGRLTEARALLLQQLSQHPTSGRVRFMLGSIDFLEKKPADGLESYAEALKLDPGLRSDAALLFNVRDQLDDKRLGRAALTMLIDQVGRPANAALAKVASEDKRPDFRKPAREACVRLGCEAMDLVTSYSLDLQQGKTCAEKREAVAGLGSTKDARAIEVLKKARRDRGGPLGGWFGLGNECVRKDIDAALTELGVPPKG